MQLTKVEILMALDLADEYSGNEAQKDAEFIRICNAMSFWKAFHKLFA